jgi:hypothetical protein
MSEGSGGNTVPVSVYEKAVADMHRYKEALRTAKADLERIGKERDTFKAERDDFNHQLVDAADKLKGVQTQLDAQPGELRKEVERLKGEITTRDHRDAFGRAAKTFKGEKGETIREDALDALWKLSGYKPEGDPDDAKLSEAIAAAVAAQPFVLQSTGQTAGSAAVAAKGGQAAVAASGRGTPDLGGGGKSFVDQLRETLGAQYAPK